MYFDIEFSGSVQTWLNQNNRLIELRKFVFFCKIAYTQNIIWNNTITYYNKKYTRFGALFYSNNHFTGITQTQCGFLRFDNMHQNQNELIPNFDVYFTNAKIVIYKAIQ